MSNTIIITIGGNNTVIVSNTNPHIVSVNATPVINTVEIEVEGPTGPPGTNKADIPFSFSGLNLSSDYDNPIGTIVTAPITLNQSLSLAIARTSASTPPVTFSLRRTREGVTIEIGTVVFNVGALVGVVTLSQTSLLREDVIECQGPEFPDTTLSDVKITLAGTRA